MTRREALALAAVAVVARPSPATAAPVDDDGDVLVRLIAREDAAALAHGDRLAADEAAHAQALRTLLDALGRSAPPGRLDASARRLDAAALESSLIAEYEAALLVLHDPGILQTAATILASHSRHRVRVRLEAGDDPFT